MTTQRHPGADLSHDGAERVQGEGREGFVASTGVPEPTGYYPYQQERDDLQRWKDEALPVIAGLQELGKALGLPLGSRITGPEAAEAATDLAVRLAEAEAKVARVERSLGIIDPAWSATDVVSIVRASLTDGTR